MLAFLTFFLYLLFRNYTSMFYSALSVGAADRNTKVKVRSPDGDTEYFDIVEGVL